MGTSSSSSAAFPSTSRRRRRVAGEGFAEQRVAVRGGARRAGVRRERGALDAGDDVPTVRRRAPRARACRPARPPRRAAPPPRLRAPARAKTAPAPRRARRRATRTYPSAPPVTAGARSAAISRFASRIAERGCHAVGDARGRRTRCRSRRLCAPGRQTQTGWVAAARRAAVARPLRESLPSLSLRFDSVIPRPTTRSACAPS